MSELGDPLGQMLLRAGALTEDLLSDVLSQQRHTLPVASICYVLGYQDETSLASSLAVQFGIPGVVLERGIIALRLLDGLPLHLARHHNVLPVFEDDIRLFFAAADPHNPPAAVSELARQRGKSPVMRVALHVTLARTVRACYASRERGEAYFYGVHADASQADERGTMITVAGSAASPGDGQGAAGESDDSASYYFAFAASEPSDDDWMTTTSEGRSLTHPIEFEPGAEATLSAVTRPPRAETEVTDAVELSVMDDVGPLDLDHTTQDTGEQTVLRTPDQLTGHSVLIAASDFATRHYLIKAMQTLGLSTITAPTGTDAVHQLKSFPPDVVVADAGLHDIDGPEICRAIKQSRSFRHIPVILMAETGQAELLAERAGPPYRADAYFE
ncbi:MAG: response regulator, partial [Myxococcota bacterium]